MQGHKNEAQQRTPGKEAEVGGFSLRAEKRVCWPRANGEEERQPVT